MTRTVRTGRRTALAVLAGASLILAACGGAADDDQDGGGSGGEGDGTSADGAGPAPASVAPEVSVVLDGEGTGRSVSAAGTYFDSSPVVVLAPDGGPRAVEAASAAVHLGVPVLVDGDDAAEAAEIDRLTATTVVAVGPVSVPADVDVDVLAPADADELAALLGALPVQEVGAEQAVARVAATTDALVMAAGDWAESDEESPSDGPADGTGSSTGSDAATDDSGIPADGGADAGAESATDDAPSGSGSGSGSDPASGTADVPDASADTAGHDVLTELPTFAAPTAAAGETFALGSGALDELASAATARAAGANVVIASGGDPRATSASVQAVHTLVTELGLTPGGATGTDGGSASADTEASTAGGGPSAAAGIVVVGLSSDLGDAEQLTYRTEAAATGYELPAGGQLVLPEHTDEQSGATYIALYGSPDSAALGVLGEQGPEETIARAQQVAGDYDALTEHTVVPTLEIIVTVASAAAGDDGNYSNEAPISRIRPLVDLAGEAGMYVILDLQPGRTDFVTQARLYEELLLEPHVGLALDPEWRLRPDQVHLTQIGQVSVEEVNEVVTYLGDLTREHDLPQKMLVLHQFQVRMLPDVDTVDQSRDEVRVLVHVDGQGPQGAKQVTWRTLLDNAPSIDAWGWKNFYDEDTPLLSPEGTMAVEPTPDLVTYQ